MRKLELTKKEEKQNHKVKLAYVIFVYRIACMQNNILFLTPKIQFLH
jgi:hypothetical protein